MPKRILTAGLVLIFLSLSFLPSLTSAEDDKVVLEAMWAIRTLHNLAPDLPIRFVEKKGSPIPGFYAVKLLLTVQDREVPVIVFVDKEAEKVIIGNLFVSGVNVTKKETGEATTRKIDMKDLEITKSPVRGPAQAKITIVIFSNFQCSHCLETWNTLREIMAKHPQDIRYVHKIFPYVKDKYSMELAEAIAGVEVLNLEAFWPVHDYLFSEVGQTLVKDAKGEFQTRVEQILKENGFNVETYRKALQERRGKKRLQEDISLAQRLYITSTPALIVNGEFLRGPLSEELINRLLEKKN
jgi:protein-disulfide isomerase